MIGSVPLSCCCFEIDLHLFGDKKAVAKRGIHRVLQIVEGSSQVLDSQRIGRRPHRFLAAKDVNRGFGKELIDIKKIGPAKHVVRHRDRLERLWQISPPARYAIY